MALYSQMLFKSLITDYSTDHANYLQLCSFDSASWLSSDLSSSNAPAEYGTRKLQFFCHSCSLFKRAFCECNFPIFIHFRPPWTCISGQYEGTFLTPNTLCKKTRNADVSSGYGWNPSEVKCIINGLPIDLSNNYYSYISYCSWL